MKDENILIWIVAFSIFTLGAAIYYSIAEGREWEAFKLAQNCKVVGKKRGGSSTGIAPVFGGNGGVGVVIVNNPDKTGWLCDDGITYWR